MARQVTYAPTPEGRGAPADRVSRHVEDKTSARDYRPWAIASSDGDRLGPRGGSTRQQTRPSFDKTIAKDEWKRPAAGASHRAYMRDECDEASSTARQPRTAHAAGCDDYTAQLRSIALEARRKREAKQRQEAARLPVARGVYRQAPPAQGGHDEVFVQGVLASEIGLVAPAAARRGPIARPNPQDLELAGFHSAFGYLSSTMHAAAEQEEAAKGKRAREYRRALQEQVASDRVRRDKSRVDGAAERKHEAEVQRLERERLAKIRDSKLKMLAAEGVKAEHMALLANYPI
jgi:hypothetical protein